MTAPERRRIAFTVEYDGSGFFGWQLQRSERTVQGELEAVLGRLFAAPVRVIGSGRTDRGVHAAGQVVAVDAPIRWHPKELFRAMNALLPDDIRVAHASDVAADFHPRYDALARSYIYRVGTHPAGASPFHRSWCWPYGRSLDRARMDEVTGQIVGDHSFRAFAKAGQEERGDRCVVIGAEWVPWRDLGLEFRITANRFLHHMIRYLVGTLVDIGAGRRPASDLSRLLRGEAGVETSPPAPPQGLFLAAVRYPPGSYSGPDDPVHILP